MGFLLVGLGREAGLADQAYYAHFVCYFWYYKLSVINSNVNEF